MSAIRNVWMPAWPVMALQYEPLGLQIRTEDRTRGGTAWPYSALHAVAQAVDAGGFGAMRAAVDHAVPFHAVADHRAAAVRTPRREKVDRALEAVERVGPPGEHDVEGLVVGVPAGCADSHRGQRARRRRTTARTTTAITTGKTIHSVPSRRCARGAS